MPPPEFSTGQHLANAEFVAFVTLVSRDMPPVRGVPSHFATRFEVNTTIKGRSEKPVFELRGVEGSSGEHYLYMRFKPDSYGSYYLAPLDADLEQYVRELTKLPDEGAGRLRYFYGHLQHNRYLLAADAHLEFRRVQPAQLMEIRSSMKPKQLLAWIRNPCILSKYHRPFLQMLEVCGSESEAAELECMLRSNDLAGDWSYSAHLDCYLALRGLQAMPLIEELYLKPTDADYSDSYTAISAICRYYRDTRSIPRARVVAAIHRVLDHPEIAHVAAGYLVDLEDWTAVDRLAAMYERCGDHKIIHVRTTIAQYLLACPLPAARERLTELEQIDSVRVQRARKDGPLKGRLNKSALKSKGRG